MKSYENYKETNIFWESQVPTHWELKKIKYLMVEKIIKGFPDEELLVASQRMGVVPKSVYGQRTVEALKDLHLLKFVSVGDFVISLRSFQGGIEYAYYQGIISPAYTIIATKGEILSDYFKYLAKSYNFILLLQTCVSGIREGQNINYPMLRELKIAVPSKDEQIRIGRYLDEITKVIDSIISDKEEILTELAELRQAIISEAVTKGLDPTAPMKDSGVEWIGKIPVGWERTKVKNILAIPICDGPHETPEILDIGIPFLSAEAVKNNKLDFSLKRGYISQENHEEFCKKTKPLKGDIFMVKSGATTGNIAMVETDDVFSIWSPLALFRCNLQEMNNYFLFYYLQSTVFRLQVEKFWSFGTQQNIGMGVLSNLWIAYPETKIQEQIVQYLDEKTSKLDQITADTKEQIALLKEYRQSLISEVVTGKVEV